MSGQQDKQSDDYGCDSSEIEPMKKVITCVHSVNVRNIEMAVSYEYIVGYYHSRKRPQQGSNKENTCIKVNISPLCVQGPCASTGGLGDFFTNTIYSTIISSQLHTQTWCLVVLGEKRIQWKSRLVLTKVRYGTRLWCSIASHSSLGIGIKQ